jgi:putative DNA methylase
MVLTHSGEKKYLPIQDLDLDLYQKTVGLLSEISNPYPKTIIEDGYNTRQILNYGYSSWHELFNARQLVGINILANAIRKSAEGGSLELLACLFSGILEFNNMFASFKGEGTGAVRHMFSHHILKPERMPLEANIWGTPKSSGSFSTLFESRLMRALNYKEDPFEIFVNFDDKQSKTQKIHGLSKPLMNDIANQYSLGEHNSEYVYLRCGDSGSTDIPDQTVDVVITDPPFFDNVHYSELADFFYVWQRHFFPEIVSDVGPSTRSSNEVQSPDRRSFSLNLRRVFGECNRVLKDDGLLIFTYHHSREDGWLALISAIIGAGFEVINTYPIKSEMSVGVPKTQAKEPINIDIIMVCKKRSATERIRMDEITALESASKAAKKSAGILESLRNNISKNDVQAIIYAELITALCPGRTEEEITDALHVAKAAIDKSIDEIQG